MGCESTTIATDDGTVRMRIHRTPDVVHCRNPTVSADLTLRTSSGTNVVAMLEGTDPALKVEVVGIGAHLDHLGRNHELMPGANDNASGVAVLLGASCSLAIGQIGLRKSSHS